MFFPFFSFYQSTVWFTRVSHTIYSYTRPLSALSHITILDPPRDASQSGNEPNHDENPLKAAIVYVHGESFEWNSGNLYDGTMLAAHGDVIVVTINFRLGILGK